MNANAALSGLALGAAVLLCSAAPAQAQSSAPASAEPSPPAPYRGPILISIGLGLDGLAAHWAELNPTLPTSARGAGPSLRLGVGGRIANRLSVLLDGQLSVAAVPPLHVVLATAAAGVDVAVDGAGKWHLRLLVRRGVTGRDAGPRAPIGLIPPEVDRIDVWLVEFGIASVRSFAQSDRILMLSALGGPTYTTAGDGYFAGLGISYHWMRWLPVR